MIIKKLLEPFHEISNNLLLVVLFIQILVICCFLQVFHSDIIPSPINIGKNFIILVSSGDFYDNLFKSFVLVFKGMFIAIIWSLILGYLSLLGMFKKNN